LSKDAKILIVDDEIQIRKFLETLITQNGYEALGASNVEEALQVMAQNHIDMVISDIKMPGLDGIELLRRIKTNWKDTEVILITGYQSVSTAREALRWGAYDYIAKPIEDLNKFMNIVENALEGQRLREERGNLLKNLEQKNVQLENTVYELNQKKQALDSMVKDLDITLEITQKISTSIVGQSSLDSLTPDMHRLFDCYAWGMVNVSQEFESLIKGDLNIFLIYDLPEHKIAEIRENVEKAYRKYGELTSIALNISSQNIIGKAQNYEHDCQINLPMISQDNVHGIAFIYSAEIEEFSEEKLHLFSIIVRQLATLRDAGLLVKMEMLSVTDELTGLYNRRGIDKNLEFEFYRAQRYKSPFAFGIFDVDGFKKVNDTYGHPTGDEILKQLATIMKRYSRQTDTMGRFGGDEFAFILPNTDIKGAYAFGENLRKKVAENEFEIGEDNKKNVTISIGIAYLNVDSQIDIKELVNNADEALYNAKHNENCTCIYGGDKSISDYGLQISEILNPQ